jgi:hypothetical protein
MEGSGAINTGQAYIVIGGRRMTPFQENTTIEAGVSYFSLTALKPTDMQFLHGSRRRCWLFICKCGKEVIETPSRVLSGTRKSCGCYASERITQANTTHGNCGTPEYISWQAMKARCYYPKNPDWRNYGGRGIAVCDRWRNSFENFLADMGPRPEGKSIDRFPDKDGNYEPGNCRWATMKEQQNNRNHKRFCKYGHELTDENCYRMKSRKCKLCGRIRDKKRRMFEEGL